MLKVVKIFFLLSFMNGAQAMEPYKFKKKDVEQTLQLKVNAAEQEMLDKNLIDAIAGGDFNKTQSMLEKGASPDARDAKSIPALFWAVKLENSDIVKLLLDRAADITVADSEKKIRLFLMHWNHGMLKLCRDCLRQAQTVMLVSIHFLMMLQPCIF